ncbi:MAG: flagellar biosynthesis protein FlhB [Planctomycetota bacterium]
MAKDENGDKTEPATAKKRGEARRKGQVAKSKEMATAWQILAFTAIFAGIGPEIFFSLGDVVKAALTAIGEPLDNYFEDGGHTMIKDLVSQVVDLTLPILICSVLMTIFFGLLETKFLFAPEKLIPDIKRLDPIGGWKKFFSLRAGVKVISAIFKMGILGLILWWTLSTQWTLSQALMEGSVENSVPFLGDTIFKILLRAGLSLLAIAIADFFYQRWQYEKDLRMSKQEIREENKQSEGNPEVKRRIRQRQRDFSRNRMIAEVEEASVVIVNPTHYAVAIRYDEVQDIAPKVIAKGQGHIALRIRAVAEEHGRPILEKPELARQLYRQVEVGNEIPEAFYVVIAEILAHLMSKQPARV